MEILLNNQSLLKKIVFQKASVIIFYQRQTFFLLLLGNQKISFFLDVDKLFYFSLSKVFSSWFSINFFFIQYEHFYCWCWCCSKRNVFVFKSSSQGAESSDILLVPSNPAGTLDTAYANWLGTEGRSGSPGSSAQKGRWGRGRHHHRSRITAATRTGGAGSYRRAVRCGKGGTATAGWPTLGRTGWSWRPESLQPWWRNLLEWWKVVCCSCGPQLLLLLLLSVQGSLDSHCSRLLCSMVCYNGSCMLLLLLLLLTDKLVHSVMMFVKLLIQQKSTPLGRGRLWRHILQLVQRIWWRNKSFSWG